MTRSQLSKCGGSHVKTDFSLFALLVLSCSFPTIIRQAVQLIPKAMSGVWRSEAIISEKGEC